ncbi:unnamed protein product [Parajaminaea phylloscopi]
MGGSLAECLAAMVWRFRIGSAVAGLDNEGRHLVWHDVIPTILPYMDVLVVMGMAGFVLDLPSWALVAAHCRPHLRILFVFGTASMYLVPFSELLAHTADPSVFFDRPNVPSEHPFVAFAEGETRRKLFCIGQEERPRRR